MATGGFVRSVDKSSDIIYDYSCSPCEAQGSHTEANYFCIDCEEHFCQKCLEQHNKFAKMRTHQVLDQTAMEALGPQQKLSLPAEKCGDHPHNIIDTYCPECDTICCGTCVSISHRSCEGMLYLPKAAAGVQKSKAYRDTKSAIPDIQKQLDEIKKEMERDINAINKEGHDMLNQIRAFRELLNKKFDELENKASDVAKHNSKSGKYRVTTNMRNLEDMMSKLESSLDKLKKTNSDNESQIFVHFKTGQKIKTEAETLLEKLKVESERSKFDFRKNTELEEYVNDLSSIGETVQYNKVITATSFDEINVKVKEDKERIDVSCICQMDNGTVLITDYLNKKMKRLSSSYKVHDYCDLPGKPHAVCSTGTDEAAVSLYSEKVQFVSVRYTITLGKSFSVDFTPEGIAYNNDKLYMTRESPGGLFIYSNIGSLLKKIENDSYGPSILPSPKHLVISQDKKNVMVADIKKGIVKFDLQGNRTSCFSDTKLNGPGGICIGMKGTLFVAGDKSNNIVKFNSNGDKLGVVLQENDGIQEPYSVCWDRVNSRLLVSMPDTDCIKAFNIK